MFDFEKPAVYKKAKDFNSDIRKYIKITKMVHTTVDLLCRALFSVVLNIA